ncbi:MAG TPA: LytTR family DNA-binding domain-containing protein [Cyclobacteriaceae bacterium]|nr:LytTR family DNA-binding domain-containing protein [Cyclobacteriaceae bacterium]HRJ82984.1 LytTR family DNA-binding domain-containing protein [Cyclobacteriaceae bacterium]
MNLTCLIVEDEPLARNLLVDYVKKVPSLHLVEACSNAMDAMELLRQQPVDLLFLDIQMPEITGITFLKILQKRPLVIFTTAYSQYALEGYELDVVDYLLKPITLERFLKAVDKAVQRHYLENKPSVPLITQPGSEKPDFVFVKDGTKMVKVRLDDILYVEGMKDYVTIHTRDKKITTLQRMKVLEEQLPPDKFIRVHHSFIIALNAIDAVHRSDVQIGQAMIPVSDSYKKAFRDFIDKNQMQ